MKKRLLAILLCVFMVAGLLPGTALAADSTSVTVGGVELDGTAGKTYWKNGDTTSASGTETDYNAYFNSNTGTLTLKGATITGSPSDLSHMNSNHGIYADGDLAITLEGTNTVTADAATDFGVSSAIYISGNLTINGSGSVSATGGAAPGYGSCGIYGGTVTIQDSANVTATGGMGAQLSEGVNGVMGVIISGSATVTATGGKSTGGSSYGIHSNYGEITISDSANVTATGVNSGDSSYGLRTDTLGVRIEGGIVTALAGRVNGYGLSCGVSGYKNTTYTGGLLVAKGDTYAMNGTVMDDAEIPALVAPLTGAYDSNFAVYGGTDTYYVIQDLDYTGAIKPTNVEAHITWTEAQDIEPATLTLNNVIVNSDATEAIKLPNGTKLVAQGVNIVRNNDVEDNSKCISGAGDLEITGTGTLVAIDGAALGGGTCSHGVAAVNNLIVSGSLNLTAIGNTAPYNDSYGVYSGGISTFSGGTITAIGGMAANNSCGLYAQTGTQISDSVKLTAIGGAAGYGSAGIYSSGATTITDGFITAIGGAADGGSSGISSGHTTTFLGGHLVAIGGAAPSIHSIHAGGGGIVLTDVSIIAPAGAGISDTGYFIATTTGGNIPATFAAITPNASAEDLPVCEIGSVQYPDLGTALLAAPINEVTTIILLQDISYTNCILADERTITIDLNGKNLTVSGVDGHALQAVNSGELNIYDVDEDGGSLSVTSSGEFRSCAHASSGGDINITGTLTALYPGGMSYQEIIAANANGTGSTITLNGNAIGYYAGAIAQNGAAVTILGNVEGSYYGAYAAYGGLVDITGNITAAANGLTVEYGGLAEVEGDITASTGVCINNMEPYDASVCNITGNIITNDASGRGITADGEADITLNGNIVANGGYGVALTGGATVTINGSISGVSVYIRVGGTTYAEGTGGVEGSYMKYSYPYPPEPENIVYVRIAEPADTVTDLVIEDAIAPINGEGPVTEIAETAEYTGSIVWTDSPETFLPDRPYTATITLTAKDGYTFEGVAADAFMVPCAMSATNDSDSGVITATYMSPPAGYITDGNGMMAFSYNGYFGPDIQGTYNGEWQQTTCGNNGYGTSFRFGDEDPVDLDIISTEPVDAGNGITIGFEPKFYSSGRFLRIVYTLHNSGSETQTVSFGSHADTQIGNDDGATITKFDDARGFKMVNSYYPVQFNFFGKGTIGVTDVDTYWFGYYYDRYNNVFNQISDPSFSGDSGMAYSWQDKTLAPGQTRIFSVLIGIGDALSGENVPIGVNFDSQGGSDVDSITVEMVGDTINAPTSPTRSGYTFGGWYTESECANQFDFTTPITATITLYAKWTQNTPPSGGGSYTPPKYPVTDTNQGEQAGGQIKLSKERAEAGDTVIITVTPDKGYENGNPVVLDTNKKPVEVTDNGNGTFSFKMPSGGVNVETKFSKIDYFDDVTENDWFDEASWYCAAHGLIQGTGHRQFDGHIGTNRAMLVTVLYRLANSTDALESIFDDVESGKWYSEAIGWAAHNKIVEGYGNGKFGPDDTLTREQMVAVLYRYSMFMKYDVSKLNSLNTFTDADAISEWALQAMKWAAGNGIVEGIGNDLISPETGATRAQFAAMMQRYITTFIQ